MPRYFFNVRDGQYLPDDTGVELASLDEARLQAVTLAGGLLKDNPGGSFWQGHDWRVEVEDDGGRLLFSLFFSVEQASGEGRPLADSSAEAAPPG